MYTVDDSVNGVVGFLSGMHYGLFPGEKADSPMIRYRDAVLDPKRESSNICWEAIVLEAFGPTDDTKRWLACFRKSFLEFCIEAYGDRFGPSKSDGD